jgi:hypothetical protein
LKSTGLSANIISSGGYMAHKCKNCGKNEHNQYIEETKEKLAENQLCFHCDFWTDKINHPKAIVIDGCHYMDSGAVPENYRGFKGHGGRKFNIKMNDGREVITNNLWFQGDVPEKFKSKIPDNAKWGEVDDSQIEHGMGFLANPKK